jgi:hypothetical protein
MNIIYIKKGLIMEIELLENKINDYEDKLKTIRRSL